MSVIVKGMEMPKYCYDCPLQDGEDGRCNILGIIVYDIPKECPLIEVVRCEDCEHYKQSEADTSRKMCWRKDMDGFPVCYDFYPIDFCSYGGGREE